MVIWVHNAGGGSFVLGKFFLTRRGGAEDNIWGMAILGITSTVGAD